MLQSRHYSGVFIDMRLVIVIRLRRPLPLLVTLRVI